MAYMDERYHQCRHLKCGLSLPNSALLYGKDTMPLLKDSQPVLQPAGEDVVSPCAHCLTGTNIRVDGLYVYQALVI
ncbi:unnamed protein product [Oppiella nova]|uniref:Uncharacterized protein n=1 Tax=Oppiella nova TaxID=334625 RepID=A0A7R9QCY3_9ACAR|nr:unnamed protein product [Oppiella nova]CAG2163298.1 unnamed protein product [Oppiella nova]